MAQIQCEYYPHVWAYLLVKADFVPFFQELVLSRLILQVFTEWRDELAIPLFRRIELNQPHCLISQTRVQILIK